MQQGSLAFFEKERGGRDETVADAQDWRGLRLKAAGLSTRQIAASLGIGQSTASEYLKRAARAGLSWPLPEGMSESDPERRLFQPTGGETRRGPARPGEVQRELRRMGVMLALVREESRAAHPDDGYGYSRFCELCQRWEGASARPCASPTRMLAFFGGVLGPLVSDTLKAGVTRACLYEPKVNRNYADPATHYDTAIIPDLEVGLVTGPVGPILFSGRSRLPCRNREALLLGTLPHLSLGYRAEPINNERQRDFMVCSPDGVEFGVEVKADRQRTSTWLVRPRPDADASANWVLVSASREPATLPEPGAVEMFVLTAGEGRDLWDSSDWNRRNPTNDDIRRWQVPDDAATLGRSYQSKRPLVRPSRGLANH